MGVVPNVARFEFEYLIQHRARLGIATKLEKNLNNERTRRTREVTP